MINKTTITIFTMIMLAGAVSAIYAGECSEIDLSWMESLDDIIWTVVGNSSDLEGLTVGLNDNTGIIKICTAPNYKPDSFTIIFIDNSTKEVIKEVTIHIGSDGEETKTVYIENKTFVEVDNYIDKEIIVMNDSKPTDSSDLIKTIDDLRLNENQKRNLILVGIFFILVIISLSIMLYYSHKNKQPELEEESLSELKDK